MGERTDKPKPMSLKQQAFISAYIGPARGNATDAARRAGYAGSDQTLRAVGSQNLTNPHIKAAIDDHLAAVRAEGIANKQNRVDALVVRHRLLEQIREERAAEYAAMEAERATNPAKLSDIDNLFGRRMIPAGAGTGLIIRQLKQIGSGRDAQVVEEFGVDTALLREMRAHEQQVAQERGEWVEKKDAMLDATDEFLTALREFGRGRDA